MSNANFFNSIIQPKWIVKRAKKNRELRKLDNIRNLLKKVKSQMEKNFLELHKNTLIEFEHMNIMIKEQEEMIHAKYR